MKTCSWMFRGLKIAAIVIMSIFRHSILQAQPIPIGNSLFGNGIVGTAYISGYNVVATSQGVYIEEELQLGLLPSAISSYEKVYEPPTGSSIQQIFRKYREGGLWTNSFYVLLNGGSEGQLVLLISFDTSYPDVRVLGTLNSAVLGATWADIAGDALYALGPSVYVSRDTAKTWQIDSTGIEGAFFRGIAVDSSQYVYAATTKGLFRQHPDSSIWHKVTTLTSLTSLQTVYIDRLNRIFVVGSSGGGIALSTDNGASWNPDTAGIGTLSLHAFADDNFGNIYASGGNGTIYKSTRGTGMWTRIDGGVSAITVKPPTINALAGDSILVAATSFGVFVTPDQGDTWYEANGGIHTEDFYGFRKNNPSRLILSTDLGIFYNDAGDSVWHKSFPQSGYLGSLPIYTDSAQTLFTVLTNTNLNSSQLGPIYKSTDNGFTWKADTLGLSKTIGRVFFVDERGGEHIGSSYAGSNYFARVYAQDANRNWVLDTSGIANTNNSYATSFGTDYSGLIYLSGTYQGNPRVLHRPITGGTWVVDTVGLPSSLHNFGAMSPGTNGEVFGTDFSTLYRHSAGVWSRVPLPTSRISKFTVDKSGTIFIVSNSLIGSFYGDAGISMSKDNGTTWTAITHDTSQVDVLCSIGDTSYALLKGGGLYTMTKNGIVTGAATRETQQLPKAYQLYQNYPNPFNPSTIISYQIPVRQFVTLKIYSILGQEVATLVNGIQDAGERSVEWKAGGMSSGVYFFRIVAGSFVDTKKMLLLK